MSALVAETAVVDLAQLPWQAWEPMDAHRDRRAYASSTRAAYGKQAVVPEGPAEGFVTGPETAGERRG
ncbi:hypothetical protein [Streptomyces sp. NRRL S-350]|uniref:hypothetical protein n=1 Tax=Streptomyces sp. NRRL S-350 TaxID=1463902 RepID=UPI0004BFECA1|nr:hypothetical protein [Streptomyces sp. NRRL S-350]